MTPDRSILYLEAPYEIIRGAEVRRRVRLYLMDYLNEWEAEMAKQEERNPKPYTERGKFFRQMLEEYVFTVRYHWDRNAWEIEMEGRY